MSKIKQAGVNFEIGRHKEVGLEISGEIDGIEIFNHEADSIVQGFLYLLWVQANSPHNDPAGYVGILPAHKEANETSTYDSAGAVITNITNLDGASPVRITLAHSSRWAANDDQSWTWIRIGGITGTCSADLHGVSKIYHDYVSGVSGAYVYDLYTDAGRTVPLTSSGTYTSGGRAAWYMELYKEADLISFNYPLIFLGRGTTLPVIDDIGLEAGEYDDYVTPSSTTRNVPAVAHPTSSITLSRDFTNNSGSSQTFEEVGLFGRCETSEGSSYPHSVLLARDTQTITIPDASTLTVNYRVKTTMSANGGPARQFMDLLYRQFTRGAYNTFLIDGSTTTDDYGNNSSFAMVGTSGDTKGITSSSSYWSGYKVGIVVGTDDGSTLPINIDNYDLGARVDHGDTTGELYYYGNIVDNWNVSGGTASFEVHRVFENRSGGNITIKEIGINCIGDENSVAGIENIHLIGRKILDAVDQITLAHGDFAKVVVTWSVTV